MLRWGGGLSLGGYRGIIGTWNNAPNHSRSRPPMIHHIRAAAAPTAPTFAPATAAEISRSSSSQAGLPPPCGRFARDQLACASCNAEASLRNASGRQRRRLRPRVRAEAKPLVTPRRGWCGALGERVRRDVVILEEHGKKSPRMLYLQAVGSRSVMFGCKSSGQGPWEMHCAAPFPSPFLIEFPVAARPAPRTYPWATSGLGSHTGAIMSMS